MMKTTGMLMALILSIGLLSAQTSFPEAGKKIYINEDEEVKESIEVKVEMVSQLQEWGYWTIVDNQKEADLIMTIPIITKRGMTATSWGGLTLTANAEIADASGQHIWKSKKYKTSPTMYNGYSPVKAGIGKLVKEMKKKSGV